MDENKEQSEQLKIQEPRDTMVWYRSFMDAIESLKDVELKYQCYLTVFKYGLDREPPATDDPVIMSIFKLIKPLIDSSIARYENCKKNGKKGGNPNFVKGKPNPYKSGQNYQKDNQGNNQEDNQSDNQTHNLNVNDNVYDNDNVNVNDNENVNVYIHGDTVLMSSSLSKIYETLRNLYPNKNYDINKKRMDEFNRINLDKIDLELLLKKIQDSEFLQTSDNLGLEWLVFNYDNVITGKYDNSPLKGAKNGSNDTFIETLKKYSNNMEAEND